MKTLSARLALSLRLSNPRNRLIRCFDNGGESVDSYTVFFLAPMLRKDGTAYSPPSFMYLATAFVDRLIALARQSESVLALPAYRALDRQIMDALLGVIPAMDGRRWKRGVDSSLVLSALTDALGRFAPAGHYFGVRTVNGSPWGFWPALDRCG